MHVQSAVYGTVRDRGINLAGKFVIGSPWNNAPVLEGWVRVHYKYLTEAWSADTFMVLPREGLAQAFPLQVLRETRVVPESAALSMSSSQFRQVKAEHEQKPVD